MTFPKDPCWWKHVLCVCVLCLTEDKQNEDGGSPASQGWGDRGRDFSPAVLLSPGCFISPTTTWFLCFRQRLYGVAVHCCGDRQRKTDTPKKKKKSLLLCWLHCPPLGEGSSGLSETQIQDQSIHAIRWNISRWNGEERKVIGPPTSLCRSLERHLAVASYVSIAHFPTRWRYFFLFPFKHSIQSQKKVIKQKKYSVFKRVEL